MAKNRDRDSDSDNTTTTTSGHNAVFIDTNLDTHLALIISDSDTVSDLKKKIMSEHPHCFPNFGEIKINALKVKRRRCFYHLSDSMLVKSAFGDAKKCWFVSVDAFSLEQHDDNQSPIDPAVSNQLAVVSFTKTPTGDLYTSLPGIVNPEFVSGNTGKDVLNKVELTSMGVGGEPCNNSFHNNGRLDLGEIQGTDVECCNDDSRNMNGDMDLHDSFVEEEHSKSRPVANKKWKRESKGAGSPLEGNETLLSNVIEEISKPKDGILENSIEDKLKTTTTTSHSLFTEPPEDVNLVAGSKKSEKKKKKSKRKKKLPADHAINEPSSLHDVGKESFEEDVGVVAKNSDMTSVAAIASEINMQYAHLSGTCEVSQMQKRQKSVQEVVEQDKLPPSSVDSLFREPLEDVHVIAGSLKKKKSKKKRKLPADQVIDAEPSSLLDVGIEGSKENVGTVSMDSDKASGLVIVSEQNVQHATLSGTVEVSQKRKNPKFFQEVVEGHTLPSSSVEDVHLVAGSNSGTKKSKKKRKKFPTDEAVNAEPSSLHDAGKEGSEDNVGTVSKDLDNASGSVVVSVQNVQHATLSGTVEVSRKQKCTNVVQEVVEGHKLPSSSVGSLFTEPPDDVHLVAGSNIGKKKSKRKMKLPTDEVVNPEPSSLHDVGKEGSKDNAGTVSNDSDKACGAVTVCEQNVQHATLSGNVEDSQMHKHPEPVQEVVEWEKLPSSSMGNNASRPVAANEKDTSDAHDSGARSRSKGRKTSKNQHYVDMEESFRITNQRARGWWCQNSAAKSLSELPTKEQEGGGEVLTPPNDMLRVVDTSSKIKKKAKSVKTSSKSQFTGQELELETNHGSFDLQQTSRTVDSTQVPLQDTLEGNSIGRPLENDEDDGNASKNSNTTEDDGNASKNSNTTEDDGNASKNSNTTDANYQREVSNCDGDRINFKDYFVPAEHKHEVAPVDKVSEAKGSDREMKTKKNAQKVVLPSPATSHDPGNSLNSYVNQGSQRRSQGVSKGSNKKMGEVVNSLRKENSLLATSGAIFGDGSSETSEDECPSSNSDSSTKAPSDKSSSSGYSEGDGKFNLDSRSNEISSAKDKDGGKGITKSQALGSKNVTLDRILRNSSRFKKAKLTASQSQLEDAESQPVDFVPDSQANL